MNNIRTSKKRDAMLALLRSTHCHPGADWVYHEMRTQYPGLSLGTCVSAGSSSGWERWTARSAMME